MNGTSQAVGSISLSIPYFPVPSERPLGFLYGDPSVSCIKASHTLLPGIKGIAIMETNPPAELFRSAIVVGLLLGILSAGTLDARPAKFLQDFRVTWADDHLKQLDDGNAIQLILDQSSGAGFASKDLFLFGHVSMKIKLVAGDSAGTVTAFYLNSDTGAVRDELDFEFLGNRSGQPYTVQTNVYARGKGDREQRVNLWFDPSAQFHTYSILWNHYHVVFFVDDVPIRVFKNNEGRGIPFPKRQPMGIYSTLWEADDWATRGGLEKIDWSKAPFLAYYRDFDIEACSFRGNATCASNPLNWWEGLSYRQLSPFQAKRYRWVRLYHMIYDYCTDKARYPITPPECLDGV